MTAKIPSGSRYRIGAVARLTGVSTETLRVWERRYGAVKPQRSEGGGRLYDDTDIARLTLLKRLVDADHAIGTIAGLSLEQLEARSAREHAAESSVRREGPASVVLVGTTLPLKLAASSDQHPSDRIIVAGSFDELSAYESSVTSGDRVDALVIEVPVVIEDTVTHLRRLQRRGLARQLVVVVGYGKSRSIAKLTQMGMVVLHYPTSWAELVRNFYFDAENSQSGADASRGVGAPAPARMFDDRQLGVIASQSTSVDCECPHHLAELIISLTRFELYSANCEDQSQEDAELHAYLHATSGHARALLETALHRLVEIEDIDIDQE